MGRPSKATVEVIEQVETALARGATIAMTAASVGVSPRTLKGWLASGVVVRRGLRAVPDPEEDEAEAAPSGIYTDERIEAAMVEAVMRAAPVDWRAARFILQTRWPQRWGKPTS